METEQTWKRSPARRIATHEERASKRRGDEPRPGWATILAITVPCAAVGIAIGVGLSSTLVSAAAVAYVAAALFVAVLAFAIHVEGDAG
jgi:Mn2+/Fe2+ NRAMP family transporter